MQSAIVIAIIALAVGYLVWRKLGRPKGAAPSCGCGCSECPSSGGCNDTPHILRPKADEPW